MHRIFISYKRQDKEIVFPMVEEIKQQTGVNCWIDLEGIESGDQFQNVIIDAIDNSDIVIFMLSKNFIAPYRDEITGKIDLKKQTFPEKEVMYALRHNKRLIPISIDGTTVYDCKWLEFNCSGLDCVNWKEEDQRDKFLNNLINFETRQICIIGEISSGKTTILHIIQQYYESTGIVLKSSINQNDYFSRNNHFTISNIQLFGNYLEIEYSNKRITILDISVLPSLSEFSSFISNIDMILYVKNIDHCQLTKNDMFRISSISHLGIPFFFIYTKCDTVYLSNILSIIEETISVIKRNVIDIFYLPNEAERFVRDFHNIISQIDMTSKGNLYKSVDISDHEVDTIVKDGIYNSQLTNRMKIKDKKPSVCIIRLLLKWTKRMTYGKKRR